jgi:hypothetical protein
MMLRKCRWKWKFYHAERRDVRREVRLMPFGNDSLSWSSSTTNTRSIAVTPL